MCSLQALTEVDIYKLHELEFGFRFTGAGGKTAIKMRDARKAIQSVVVVIVISQEKKSTKDDSLGTVRS